MATSVATRDHEEIRRWAEERGGVRRLPWSYEGRPASELTSRHFARHLPELRRRVGLDSGAVAGAQ